MDFSFLPSVLNFHLTVHSSLRLFFFSRTSFISFSPKPPFPAWYINRTLLGVFFLVFLIEGKRCMIRQAFLSRL